jgi:hypothetical protein
MRPSWERWPPNCCESCIGPWVRKGEYWGICGKSDSLEFGTSTDTRFRCPAFERRPEPPASPNRGGEGTVAVPSKLR